MKTLTGLLACAAIVILSGNVWAHCGHCGAGDKKEKEAAPSCSAKRATDLAACPVAAAVEKLDLTDEQKKKIEEAGKTCEEALKKAGCLTCSHASAKGKMAAYQAYVKEVKAVLTDEQQKKLDTLLPGKKACCPVSH